MGGADLIGQALAAGRADVAECPHSRLPQPWPCRICSGSWRRPGGGLIGSALLWLSVPRGTLSRMTGADPKADLHRYLQLAREALLWKLDGLSEYDIRRPLTPTGTNLLGLVKHLAGVELWYFGDAFGRPPAGPRPWSADDARNNADFWATADESRDKIARMYRQAWAHADETIRGLALDAVGHVPWWPSDQRQVTLHRILVHVVAETNRHAGHADIVRELIDGAAGLQADSDNLRTRDRAWWENYHGQLEQVAREASHS